MREPAFIGPALPILTATVFIPSRARRHRLSRLARPCARPFLPAACAKPSSSSSSPLPSEPFPPPSGPLVRMPTPPGELTPSYRANMPVLFSGPEAVLGIVLAAAALLADFAAGLMRLATRGADSGAIVAAGGLGVEQRLTDVDDSIALLQAALDGSKRALAETEASLDATIARANSAEAAMQGIGDSRDRLQKAMDQAAKAELEVRRIQESLRVERGRRESVAGSVGEREEEKTQVEEEVARREKEVAELRGLLKEVRESGEGALKEHERREIELAGEVGRKEEELDSVREERERLGEEAKEMERRAATMSEQVSAATLALEETRLELEKAQMDLERRRGEQEVVEKESAEVVARSAERERMREKLREMEGELEETRRELRTRDKIVEEVSLESDQLASLLAARDAELHKTQRKLESAVAGEQGNGGDSSRSDLSLEEIKNNLNAEQKALSAEIAKADLARSDISEEDLDPLDRLEREMEVEGDLLQAGLRKAETTVTREEHLKNRKEGAVEEVLESIGKEEEDGDGGLKEVLEGISVEDVSEKEDALAVSKQAQSKTTAKETKPKKRRGRPPKTQSRRTGTDGEEGGGQGPQRKRGRPRKTSPLS